MSSVKSVPKVVLLGPTGVGKTALSFQLADVFGVPIVSVDSRQCYKYLNIGTAKPSSEELLQFRHYNISELEPNESESAGRFLERLNSYKFTEEAPFNFFVGGSTLHIQALLFGLDNSLPKADIERVQKLSKWAESDPKLIATMLRYVDPDYASSMQGFNPQRTIRALDVWIQTGVPFSKFHSLSFKTSPENSLVIGLRRPRNILYKRAEQRIDSMIESGLLDEIGDILKRGFSFSDPGLSSVGYKEFEPLFVGNKSEEECIEEVKKATRRYIKRQETWFKRWSFINWYDVENVNPDVLIQQVEEKITNFLAN